MIQIRTKHLAAAGVKKPDEWIEAIRKTCEEFEINTEKRVAAFIGQCAHESAGFSLLQENLNYSAETMAAVWPNRFAEIDPATKKPKKDAKSKNIPNKFALALHRKPEMLANVVYSGRMGNGPTESGDGWLFRGRGLKQLTGRDNVTRCGKALGVDFASNPDLLLQPEYAARSAGWFWKSNNCSDFIDRDDFVGLTKRINGGTIGLDDRKKRYEAVLASMQTE